MIEIYVNLKRFDVPQIYGGICPENDPVKWVREIIRETIEMGLGSNGEVMLVYFLPEALIVPALEEYNLAPHASVKNFQIGCQSVYREDVDNEGNFGSFTSNRPAAAMCALGESWVMIGHSEERKDKLSLLENYDQKLSLDPDTNKRALDSVEQILNQEVNCALKRSMNVLFCIGETAEQKGSNNPSEYEPRVKEVLKNQICKGLSGIDDLKSNSKISIGYEPIWAIGPGKIPPNGEYVAFVSSYIKDICKKEFGKELPVVYGGGLKEENAAEMSTVKTLDGGLVALTKFTDPVAFDVKSLKNIIENYIF